MVAAPDPEASGDESRGPALVFASSRPTFPLTFGAGTRTHQLLTGLLPRST